MVRIIRKPHDRFNRVRRRIKARPSLHSRRGDELQRRSRVRRAGDKDRLFLLVGLGRLLPRRRVTPPAAFVDDPHWPRSETEALCNAAPTKIQVVEVKRESLVRTARRSTAPSRCFGTADSATRGPDTPSRQAPNQPRVSGRCSWRPLSCGRLTERNSLQRDRK